MKRLTPKLIQIKLRKFHLIAGTLHVESSNQKLPPHVRMSIARAHDVLWEAIRDIEALPADAPCNGNHRWHFDFNNIEVCKSCGVERREG